MPVTLQVIYPVSDDSTFDHEYYIKTHMALVAEHMGSQISSTLVTKGLSGGPKTAAPYHTIASIVFPDQDAMNSALRASGPVMADVVNFTNVQPQTLIGEVIG